MLIDLREEGREGDQEGNINAREKHRSIASHTPSNRGPLVHAPVGDWTCKVGMEPWLGLKPITFQFMGSSNQVNHTSKGIVLFCLDDTWLFSTCSYSPLSCFSLTSLSVLLPRPYNTHTQPAPTLTNISHCGSLFTDTWGFRQFFGMPLRIFLPVFISASSPWTFTAALTPLSHSCLVPAFRTLARVARYSYSLVMQHNLTVSLLVDRCPGCSC